MLPSSDDMYLLAWLRAFVKTTQLVIVILRDFAHDALNWNINKDICLIC